MTAVDLLAAVLHESFTSSTWSFADDDDEHHQGRFRKALNALFEDEEDDGRGNDDEVEGNDATSASLRQGGGKDEVLAERFMHSISDLLSGNEVLFDSSCQSLSIYDLTTPLTPINKKGTSSDSTPAKSCSSSVATDPTVSATSRHSSSDSNASREFQSSIRNIMHSFSEIMSGGRAFTTDECDKVKREIVRLRQLRRRMSASEKFGVDFAGFSRSAHRPGTEHGRRRALNLDQQKRQLANIMAWDVEGWKQKTLLSTNNSATDLSVDGFHDKKELREYIEQKYGMKQVSDVEKSRKSSKPRTSHCPVPLTRIDEDGVKSPITPRARGRLTVRTLEQNRRSTSTPRPTQPKSVVDRSVSPSRRRRETVASDSSPSRRPQSTTEARSKDGKRRETKSPSRQRQSSPSDRSQRPTTPSQRSRRATTPTDRSKRNTTPTDRSKRTMTPSDRSSRVLSKDAAAQCRSPSSRRSTRTAANEVKTPGRARRSASPTITPSQRSKRQFDASKSAKRSQSPSLSVSKRDYTAKNVSKLPSVPSLSTRDSVEDSTSPSTDQRRSSSRNSSPTKEKSTEGSERRKRTDEKERRGKGSDRNHAVAALDESSSALSCDLKDSDLKSALRRGSGGGGVQGNHRSNRSLGEVTPSNRASRSTHLSTLTTHLARATARRRGRSCARSVHSARSASTTADKSNRSQRSSVRRLSVGASGRSQRLSQKLELGAKSPADDSQHSRRSLNTRASRKSNDTLATTEHSESRFDANSTDSSAPKTPQRRSSIVGSGKSSISTPTTASSATDAGATTSTTTTHLAGNGDATPRRRTVRHDLAEIIRGNSVPSTPVEACSDSVATPPSTDAAKRQGIGTSSHHPRSSIKMILSPQRRTIRDFLKSQPAEDPIHGLSESGCNQTVG